MQKIEEILNNFSCIASLAPAWKAEFPNILEKDFICALKALGFWQVSQTELGVPLVVAKSLNALFNAQNNETCKSNFNNLHIVSACPMAVKYIKNNFSDMAKNLAENTSPIVAHAEFLKSIYGKNVKVIFIGACSSKREEAKNCPNIEESISFKTLRELFKKHKIDFSKIKGENCSFVPFKFFANNENTKPSFDGGVSKAVLEYEMPVKSLAVSGIKEIANIMEDFRNKKIDLKNPLLLTVLACPGGCLKSKEITKM